MNQNEVYSLPDILSRANCISNNQTFSFLANYTVWYQGGEYVTHYSNYERHMSHKDLLDNIEAKLKSRIPIIKNMLDKNTLICSDVCQLIAEYYVQHIDLDDLIIQYTKINFSYPLKQMHIGVNHNAGGMDCMYVIDQYFYPTKTIDLSNLPKLVFWLKNPIDVKELCVSFDFIDTESQSQSENENEKKFVYQDVQCNVEYKLYYIPKGCFLKKLRHILSGCSVKYEGSILVKQERKLCYNEKATGYMGIPTWLYEENKTPDCIIAKPEYKEKVNNLLPNYYL